MFFKDFVGAQYRGIPCLRHCKADVQKRLFLLLVWRDRPYSFREAGPIIGPGLDLFVLFDPAGSLAIRFH